MTTRAVVIGAGFGGLLAARRLARAAGEHDLTVTLVDRHNYHTFQPLLYQVATSGLQPQDIGRNLRAVFGLRGPRGRAKPVEIRVGEVTGVDWDTREVVLREGDRVGFDHLVVAAGAVTNDYGIPGVDEHAFGLKSIADAQALRNHILRQFERAEAHAELIDGGGLTFVIAGGGPTGVELAGATAELIDGVLRKDHPSIDVARTRVVLVEMLDTLLPSYAPSSSTYARRTLEARGVEVRLGTAIERVEPDRIVLDDGSIIATSTLVWTAGVAPSPLAAALDVDLDGKGRVVVGPDLSIPGRSGAWAIGDIAGATGVDGDPLPMLAPVAIQQGKHVAAQVVASIEGRSTRPFRYVDKGTMATIGRHDAVTELPGGIRIRGFLAWIAWLFLHLLYLVGFRNRVAVFLSWLWNYLTFDRSARLILDTTEAQHRDPPVARDERASA